MSTIPPRLLADTILILNAYERELSVQEQVTGIDYSEWHDSVRRTMAGLLVLVSADNETNDEE